MNDINQIPNSWETTKLKNIGTFYNGVTYKKADASKEPRNGLLPILRANNINVQLNFTELVYVPREKIKVEQIIRENDIVICMSSGSKHLVGKAAQAVNDFDGGFGAFCGLFRCFPEIDPKFVGYFFQSPKYRYTVSEVSKGVNINNLRRAHIEDMEIPVPPLPEQKRIVTKIEELFTQLDAGVAELQQAKARLQRYRQAVLKAAVTGELTREWRQEHQDELEPASVLLERILKERREKWEEEGGKGKYKEPSPPDTDGLPELPEGWVWTDIEPLLDNTRDGMKTGPFGSLLKKHEHQERGIPVIGIENIGVMHYVPGSKIHITKEKAEQLTRYDVQEGDLVLSRSGTVGEVAVIPAGLGDARLSTNVMRITLAPLSMRPIFFAFLFNGSPLVLEQVSDLCKGSTRDFLNQSILKSIVFPLPTLDEQDIIIQKAERRLSVADEIEKELDQALARSEHLRQSILKRAFEGRLV